MQPYRFSAAPMLDWSTSECRQFWRLLTQRALLYTEMVTTGAILHGDAQRHLAYMPDEQPLALQLGGSDPQAMAQCARLAEQWGYSEVNINVGCPSDRVQNGRFGACLMAEPDTVAACVAAMRDVVAIPVTVKTRIGIDQQDSYVALLQFIDTVAKAGCERFIIHARKAWLHGLSPKQNREIPPLKPDWVLRLKSERPDLVFVLNGGLCEHAKMLPWLDTLDGVMWGRAAYQEPWLLADVDHLYFAEPQRWTHPLQLLPALEELAEQLLQQGGQLWHLARHTLGLFNGRSGAKQWRRQLSEGCRVPSVEPSIFYKAAAGIRM